MLPTSIRTGEGRGREATLAFRHAKATEVAKAARLLVTRMRHMGMKGLYQIPPELVLRLCSAIDDLGEAVEKGDDEWSR